MSSCLGMYIENNLIKYAKVSKEQDKLKVEAFGIKFYESIGKAIEQIVEETYSYKVPISINLSNEMYTYFNMFSLLGKKYMDKAIRTEFDSWCAEKEYNPGVLESRYALVNEIDDKDKVRVINVSANKLELNKDLQQFEGYKLINISPLSMSITNLVEFKEKENAIVVNMEKETTITTVLDQNIYDIKAVDFGSEDVLRKINRKENSYAKAYEACKNTTIYTAEAQDIATEQSYLDDIMPTIGDILLEVKKVIDTSVEKIKNVYITGTLASINNIDLYFEEYLPSVHCTILKPYFATKDKKEISIKDYIEVNSAISLALQGLNEGVSGMNFKKNSFADKLPDWLTQDVGGSKTTSKGLKGGFFTNDFGESLTRGERNLVSVIIAIIITIVLYGAFSILLGKQIENKSQEVDELISDTQEQIQLAEDDKGTIDTKTNEYKSMLQALENLSDRTSDINQSRNMIPNLLNQIMFIIPENVQITSIENTTDKHIVIVAQASQYEQLGYFKAKLKSDGILNNVVSDSGVSEGGVVKVTIEGDLL